MGRRLTSLESIRRQWKLLGVLATGWFSIQELAYEFEVSKSTIQRDIDVLRSMFRIEQVQTDEHSQRSFYGLIDEETAEFLGQYKINE